MKSYLRFLGRNKLYTAIEVVGMSQWLLVALELMKNVPLHYLSPKVIHMLIMPQEIYTLFVQV